MVPRHSTSSQFSDRNVSQANKILGPYEHLEKIPTHIEGMIWYAKIACTYHASYPYIIKYYLDAICDLDV